MMATFRVIPYLLFLFSGPTMPLDLARVPRDLETPVMTREQPAAGKRVRHVLGEYEDTEIFHVLYLPSDWRAGQKYPVIFEYPGNGPFKNNLGDTNSGRVEDCNLGYGISGGKGFIWVCLPFVNKKEGKHQLSWWGDADATAAYCRKVADQVCREFGGDPKNLILAGFSRGAIACNYIGLRDDAIAGLWRAFVVHSHYDGVRTWPYAESDRKAAGQRLARLKGRPQFISHESSTRPTQKYLQESGVAGDFTFVDLPFPNHTDTWVLRDLPQRRQLREWLERIIEPR